MAVMHTTKTLPAHKKNVIYISSIKTLYKTNYDDIDPQSQYSRVRGMGITVALRPVFLRSAFNGTQGYTDNASKQTTE